MKTLETEDLERRLMLKYFKPGTHIVFEVSLANALNLTNVLNPLIDLKIEDVGIADAMVCDNYGNISCFELKITKSDFHSKAKLSFIGHMNYYVMPQELYEQVKNEIPEWVGVLIPKGNDALESAKRAKRQEMKYDVKAVLISMLTASSNTTTVRNIYRLKPNRFIEPERIEKLRFNKNKHRYARLIDGTIEPLYYSNPNGELDLNKPRRMEFDGKEYSLCLEKQIDDNSLQAIVSVEMPIVQFLEEKE